MSIAELITALEEAGAPIAAIKIAVRAVEEASALAKSKAEFESAKTEKRSARNRRYYAKHRLKDGAETDLKTPENVLNSSENQLSHTRAPVLCVAEEEVIPLTGTTYPISTPSNPSDKPSSRKPTARDELTEALGPDLAAEIVAHRQRMRAAMSPQTAARLAKQFLSTGNPQDAARMMMDKGWRSFESDWYQNALALQSRAPNGQHVNGNSKSVGAALERLQAKFELEQTLQFDLGPSPLLTNGRGH